MARPGRPHWLDRGTVRTPYMTLCLSAEDFGYATRHIGLTNPGEWIDERKHMACTHTFTLEDGKVVCIVCLGPRFDELDSIEQAATIVHEAVHVVQRLFDWIGEERPGREFEAYAIERVTEALMREYVRRMQG